jgi:hypothetical protein
LVALIMVTALAWLKAHEEQLVFATARSREYLATALPANAERVTVPMQGGGLAGVIVRADASDDTGYWILHLHGNADSAFSPWQLRHYEALHRFGFSVLAIDYRGSD